MDKTPLNFEMDSVEQQSRHYPHHLWFQQSQAQMQRVEPIRNFLSHSDVIVDFVFHTSENQMKK